MSEPRIERGRTIDRYQIEDLLGRGGMAAVYRVRHAQLNRLYALKVLLIPSASIRARLIQEGRLQASLQHPNILNVIDVIDVDGAPGLVMEFVDGPSLDRLIESRRLTTEQISELVPGVFAGVGEAHQRSMIHRDLKPANILLARSGSRLIPKIADFGLAKVLGDGASGANTRSGIMMGTPFYMAPEQFRNAKRVDQRADIFSLGAILYELLCGRRAYEDEDMVALIERIGRADRIPSRDLAPHAPDAFHRAIDGALDPDRDRRIPDCATLEAVWQGRMEWTGTPVSVAATGSPWDGSILDAFPPETDRASVDNPNATLDFSGPPGVAAASTLDEPAAVDPAPPVAATAPAPSVTDGVVSRGLRFYAIAGGVVATLVVLVVAGGSLLAIGSGFLESAADGPPPPIESAISPAPLAPTTPTAPVEVEAGIASEPEPTAVPTDPKPKPVPRHVPAAPPVTEPSQPAEPPPAETVPPSDPPTPVEAPATHAEVTVTGDALRVFLDDGNEPRPPGRVPPGRYALVATFAGRDPMSVGNIDVVAGQSVRVDCTAALLSCRPK